MISVDQALALFGRPHSVTGLYRALRGIKSREDDTFTLLLQYAGEQENLVVTVKTTVINKMPQPLKYFVRGYHGTYTKHGEDPQEGQTGKGLTPADAMNTALNRQRFTASSPPSSNSTKEQKKITALGGNEMYNGKFPSLKGSYADYYEDVVKAIRG